MFLHDHMIFKRSLVTTDTVDKVADYIKESEDKIRINY